MTKSNKLNKYRKRNNHKTTHTYNYRSTNSCLMNFVFFRKSSCKLILKVGNNKIILTKRVEFVTFLSKSTPDRQLIKYDGST